MKRLSCDISFFQTLWCTDVIPSCWFFEDKSLVSAQMYTHNEPNGTPELSPRGANDDSIEGAAPQLNGTNDEGDDDDPFSKRR